VPFHVRDQATDAIVRRLAKRKGTTLTAAIREACEKEYARACGESTVMAAVREAQTAFRASGPLTGMAADKAFYDELSGEDELTGRP
jgi:antitoxin VapB